MSSLAYRVIFQIKLLKVMLGLQGYLVAFPGWVYERVGGIIQRPPETHHILLIPTGPLNSPYHSRSFMNILVSFRNSFVSSKNFKKKQTTSCTISPQKKIPKDFTAKKSPVSFDRLKKSKDPLVVHRIGTWCWAQCPRLLAPYGH